RGCGGSGHWAVSDRMRGEGESQGAPNADPHDGDRVEQVCHAALALEPAARAAFVADACAGDERTRREVESLLRHESKVDGFLVEPALLAAARHIAEESERTLIGRQIGAYHVQSLLGTGGMGEVYRARDTKLNRLVAIKVLLPALANDPDRLARFSREAQLLASLNHPHIAQIHGFENAGGLHALVMELIEGPTLADRIALAPISLEEALTIARQIAEAVDAAHEKGIIHRDLKPANIKIARNGVVKVLDFGLAKVWDGALQSDLSGSPRLTATDLGERTILGTAAYMSPEQARGQSLDLRTDIWSFGCVLYEMLTGRAPFAGDTISDTLAAILEREPDPTMLPADTPVPIRRLLRRCLEKDHKR